MNIIKQNRAICAALALLLCLGMLLAACDRGEKDPVTEPEQTTEQAGEQGTAAQPEQTTEQESESASERETEPETETEVETVTYTVSVIGSDGSARQGAIVRFYLGEEQVTMVPTIADGTAAADLPAAVYTVVIDNILGEKYDIANATLSPESPALSVQLFAMPTSGEDIFAYSTLAGDYVDCHALRIGEGTYWATLAAGDMTYFIFVAPRGGMFRIRADEQLPLSIGYYGSTFYVLPESTAVEENNAIMIEVYDDMVNHYAFVIGVGSEDAALDSCMLHVEYVGERELTDEDLPWTPVLPEGELPAYQKPAGNVRPFDVTSTKVQAVYNPEDGYYHLNSADGAVLLLNIGNNSPYMDALTTVVENMRLGVYVYDADGKLLSKDSYNELILAYSEVSDGGYYPLDATLANMMQTLSAYVGWGDASSPMYLFAEQPLVVPENAWLFACVYAQ